VIVRLFEREVDYLWSRLGLAARDRESLAPLWSRDGDPRVVRLVESAAYVFARVKEKLEDDVPEIAHALVAGALPEVLRPTPSATVVCFEDAQKARRNVVEHGPQRIDSRAIEGASCTFVTSWPVLTAPIVLESGSLRLREAGVQVLGLRFSGYPGVPPARVFPVPLRIFVLTPDPLHALDVVRALRGSPRAVHVRALDANGRELAARDLEGAKIRWTALDEPLRLTPGPLDRFAAGTALRALSWFPEAFAFFDITGLEELRAFDERVRSFELAIRLERPVGAAAAAAEFRLGCAPAVNVYEGRAAPLEVSGLGPCGTIRVAGRPWGEVFHVAAVRHVSDRDPDRPVPVHLWERTATPHAYNDDDLYVRLDRRPALQNIDGEVRAVLLRPSGAAGVARGVLQVDLLATDGRRTETLLRGDVDRRSDAIQIANITRVTPPRSPVLGERLPWRLNATARMSVFQFAQLSCLKSYLALHDVARAGGARAGERDGGGVLSVKRSGVKRVVGHEVHHGDAVDFVLDEAAFGGRGAAWLVGELLARAVSERADALRYTRTRWMGPEGSIEADYGIRPGERLPPPFG
jgi:type VI secretion system protein ImpG